VPLNRDNAIGQNHFCSWIAVRQMDSGVELIAKLAQEKEKD